MFDTEIDAVVSALKVKKDKIESKGIKSIRSRVTNIVDLLDKPMTIEEFRLAILSSIFGGEDKVQYWELTEEDWANIHKLSEERYQKWEWNYGKSPKSNIQHSHRFPTGSVDVRLEVNKGVIEEVKFFGDFFGVGEVEEVEVLLVGKNYSKEAIEQALESVDVPKYFGGITKEELIQLMY